MPAPPAQFNVCATDPTDEVRRRPSRALPARLRTSESRPVASKDAGGAEYRSPPMGWRVFTKGAPLTPSGSPVPRGGTCRSSRPLSGGCVLPRRRFHRSCARILPPCRAVPCHAVLCIVCITCIVCIRAARVHPRRAIAFVQLGCARGRARGPPAAVAHGRSPAGAPRPRPSGAPPACAAARLRLSRPRSRRRAEMLNWSALDLAGGFPVCL